ncbi:uncharacterized protein MYCFIDRAFT_80111 [Pseudocercospora fijiensis CIRAD86]|uniref:Histone-lysine N-methyltransferase, H3 lysine-79 specific n=1 Tax=Pseudocercospora fijiensis (strain CIRAD86) TaxID=383855 RepID=N1Q7N1_PSEFD|nr:uncharacterized protein MYCFIDRAFT_80111 [Pseudocercospora fijiensis CIRAD86]EME88730.1 hypothetical protein MYCFIDRAFT_80111 [Pseudocercospora fijiensis CIRAD86]
MSAPHGYSLRPFIKRPNSHPFKIGDAKRIKPRNTSSSLSPEANEGLSNAPSDPTSANASPASTEDGTLQRLRELISSMPVPATKNSTLRTRKLASKTRSRNVLAPLELHHSADNHDASPHDVDLRYPSGLAERFAFARRTYKKDHRYARQLDPFVDLVHTISVLLESTLGPKGPQVQICSALRQAWLGHENWSAGGGTQTFKDTIEAVNVLTGHQGHKRPELTPDFLEHFFDQLHDRVIADNCTDLLHRSNAKSTENVYGELRPKFLSRIFKDVGLDSKSVYLDLGCGVGQTAMQASLETQCEAHGIERERKVHALAQFHLTQFRARAELYGLPYNSHVVLRQGDFLTSRFVRDLLPVVDVVLLNNLKLDSETDIKVCGMLEEGLKDGARVVSTRSLKRLKRGGNVRVRMVDGWRVERLHYEAESVSWTDSEGEYFVQIRLQE